MLPSKSFRTILLLLSGGLFLASLTQPAFYLNQANREAWANSLFLLLFGWVGHLGLGAESLVWWANPLYVGSLVLLANDQRSARWTASAAALLAAVFSTFDTVVSNEAGHRTRVFSLEGGYYLWLTSMVLLAVGSLVYFYLQSRQVKD